MNNILLFHQGLHGWILYIYSLTGRKADRFLSIIGHSIFNKINIYLYGKLGRSETQKLFLNFNMMNVIVIIWTLQIKY